ncbi:Glycosyl transferase, family 20 [Artemisia annua]|uniref:Glycosyl transferase, family 20 n=1 Tax=Artemisia annua TaxID=35608 RepID=A0A2U1MID0_ARTAN|nr:Glycosyl transferase, family 20 [Artemisia annua]
MGEMLEAYPMWQWRAMLVQILNTARGKVYMWLIINIRLGSRRYVPIVIVNSPVSITEKDVYYADFEAVVVTPVQGLNTCIDHAGKRCKALGIGLKFRPLDENFRKWDLDMLENAYRGAKNRVILLDYDGTIMPEKNAMVWHYKSPGEFGLEHAKELSDHHGKVIANDPLQWNVVKTLLKLNHRWGETKCSIFCERVGTDQQNNKEAICVSDDEIDEQPFCSKKHSSGSLFIDIPESSFAGSDDYNAVFQTTENENGKVDCGRDNNVPRMTTAGSSCQSQFQKEKIGVVVCPEIDLTGNNILMQLFTNLMFLTDSKWQNISIVFVDPM